MGETPRQVGMALGWSCPSDREFEVAKASFDQNFQQFRHLNDQMNRLPAFAVTLTGGFWYMALVVANYGRALGPVEESLARWGLMIFAGLCDLTLACIAIRVRPGCLPTEAPSRTSATYGGGLRTFSVGRDCITLKSSGREACRGRAA